MDPCALSVLNRKMVKKKPRKIPLKVVYISNPMNFKASASEFRALVQELTGQDAELPPDPTRFSGGGNQRVSGAREHDSTDTLDELTRVEGLGRDQKHPAGSCSEIFDPLDEIFQPQMIDNISGIHQQLCFTNLLDWNM